LLVILKIILNHLLFNEGSEGLDAQDSILLDLPLFHDCLIPNDEGPIDHLKDSRLQQIGIVVLSRRELIVLKVVNCQWKIKGERSDRLNELRKISSLDKAHISEIEGQISKDQGVFPCVDS